MLEYALITGLLSVAVLALIVAVGSKMKWVWGYIDGQLEEDA